MDNSSLKKYLEEPEKYIPYGFYCYNDNGVCPFWESKKGEYPDQEDGYCHYLNKSDWDLNEIKQYDYILTKSQNKDLVGKTVAEVFGFSSDENIDSVSGKKVHFGLSLIWDQCKECNINNSVDDEYLEHITVKNEPLNTEKESINE